MADDYLIKVSIYFLDSNSEDDKHISKCTGHVENVTTRSVTLRFEDQFGKRAIIYDHPHVTLIQGKAKMYLNADQSVDNDYYTAMGTLPLTVAAKKIRCRGSHFTLMYDIYQNDTFIEHVLLSVGWRLLSDETDS